MTITQRGVVLTLTDEEVELMEQVVDMVDNIEKQAYNANIKIPDDMRSLLTDLYYSAKQLKDTQFGDTDCI